MHPTLRPAARTLLATVTAVATVAIAITVADWRKYAPGFYSNFSDLDVLADLLDDFNRDCLAMTGDNLFASEDVRASYELITRPELRQAVLDLAQEQYA